MKKKLSISVTSIAVCLLMMNFFQSCSKKSGGIDPEFAQYISAFTYGVISPESYIQMELMHEMPAVELNNEVKEQLFSFSPSIKGKTYWINSTTVRFVPEAGELAPGKEYKAKFHLSKVLQVENQYKTFSFAFKVSEQKFSADILPYSPMNTSDLTWNTVSTELLLTNPATEEEVQKMFEISNAPKETKVRVTAANNTTFRISIDSLLRTDKPYEYNLTINGKSIGAQKNVTTVIPIPPLSKDHFEVVDIRLVQHNDPHIRITFSDPVSQTQDIQGMIVPSEVNNFTYQIDKNVIKLYPETLPQNDINVQINQGMRNTAGLNLDKNYTYQLKVESSRPEIKFEKSGNILPNSEQLVLPFKAVNLWAVDVKIIKVYRNNILYYLQTNSLGYNTSNELRRFGRLVKKVRIRLDSDKSVDLNKWNNFSVDLAPMMEKDPGALYIVQLSMKQDYSLYRCGSIAPRIPDNSFMNDFSQGISDQEEEEWDQPYAYYYESMDWENYKWEERDDPCKPSYYINQSRKVETIVTASNIGIIAKAGNNNNMTIAATDVLTTDPLSDATVNIYNYQMQVIGSGKTDKNGFAEINYDTSKPFVITVNKGKDTGYLEVKNEASLSLSSFDVSGKEIKKGLKGYLYGERGVWRPGDTIRLTFILEDKIQKLPEKHPVSLEVYTPTRQFYQRQVKTEGLNGFYTFDIPIDPMAQTGTWQAYVKVGGTSFYKSLRVETIKPNRLKVRLESDSIIDASKGVFSGRLTSQWLHGAPASNLKADVEISLSKTELPFQGYTQYTFNNPLIQFESNKHKLFEGTLNETGTAAVNATIPVAETAPGMLRGNILSRVYETGGDMSFYTQTVYYSPYSAYVGVKSPASAKNEFLETDRKLTFDVVTLNAYGKKVSRDVEYRIFKLEWSWWWNSTEENLGSYVNNTAVRPVAKGNVTASNGNAKIDFQVDYPDWGRYLIVVKDPDGGHAAGTIFYVDWPAYRGRSNKTDPDGLTMLSFTTDKQTYAVGETATVVIPKSSAGRALVSIENGSRIIQREWIKTSAGEDTQYTFRVTEEMNPNFYIFTTLLQPHDQNDNDLPIRMYGVVNISVENKESKLEPVISMPGELRPEKEFTVSVSEKSRKPMTYTLAIVDEGLLDLTAFKTPNAWNEFYAREALGVRTWDLFDRVLGANTGLFGPLLSIGGDEALKASGDKVNRFKPVVKFLGPFSIKDGETKTHQIKLPAYVGSVRTMVVAGGNGAYGNAEKTVQVRNALMTLTTLPRVMGPNEEVHLPVNVFVTDAKVKNVTVSIRTKGLMSLVDGTTQTIAFDKPGDQVVFFKLKAGKRIGEEEVSIQSTGNGETFTETINIGIRNPNPPVILTKTAFVAPGENAQLSIESDNVGANDWAKLELSRLPGINFNKNLQFLLEYPHGCTEQVTSQGFPLLYIHDFIALTEEQKQQMSDKVIEVIRILSSRQLADGGFMYWSGNSYASEWVSTYAGHFLTEARNKGYEVPETVLSNWIRFQQKLARNWTPTNPYRHYYSMTMTELQQAYRLYSLSLAANPELGAMNRMREMKELNTQARWQLASAYALAGRKDVSYELIFNASSQIDNYTFNNDTYGTPARDQAMIMETYLLLGETEKAFALAPSVAQALSADYISTQTTAFGLTAMQKLAMQMGRDNIHTDWTVNGKNMDAISTAQPFHQENLAPSEKLSVNVSNKGESSVYVRLTAQTQPIEEIVTPSQASFGLSVRYVNAAGNRINIESLKQGEEFTAIVTVQNNSEQPFTDLALVQIFPSGWEIFNERMMNAGSPTDEAAYTYRDIRDDRTMTYFNLGVRQTKTFSVRLQAAYRGSYYLPPVSCQAMYAPQEQARTSGMWVHVIE